MTLKAGLLGTSGHTKLVLDGIPEIEDCEFVGICPGCKEQLAPAGIQRLRREWQ